MFSGIKKYWFILTIIMALCFYGNNSYAQSRYGAFDTLYVPYLVMEGDTVPYRELEPVYIMAHMTAAQRKRFQEWTRLRNAVYVTYPYARTAGKIINEVNMQLQHIPQENKRKTFLKSKESELKKKFADPLTSLSVYQGKVLMKLINRETNNNCYDLIKEYRGGFSARFWQTIAWVFGSSLKQSYDPMGEDAEMESIVKEVAMMYRPYIPGITQQ
ncbi:MAG: DUF4294 domain-containing protein [Chitinophagaceae bacterium]